MRLLAFAASLRQASFNRKLLAVAAGLARRHGVEVLEHPFADFDVPAYSGDVQDRDGIPAPALRLGQLIQETDGLLLAAPEYNYSLPGHLKNTIDWVSRIRPVPLRGRWAFLMSASTGAVGGIRGLWQLRIPFEGLGTFVHPDMFSLPHAAQAFTPEGDLADAAVRERLETMLAGYLEAVRKGRA
ncbi:MAG: NAD(P)H-dependent oxidoreductase [Gemmatimonadales bacterium]|nr:NAD(P)H-dependent oxidoreductase [Gemmatimonadales bacterium]